MRFWTSLIIIKDGRTDGSMDDELIDGWMVWYDERPIIVSGGGGDVVFDSNVCICFKLPISVVPLQSANSHFWPPSCWLVGWMYGLQHIRVLVRTVLSLGLLKKSDSLWFLLRLATNISSKIEGFFSSYTLFTVYYSLEIALMENWRFVLRDFVSEKQQLSSWVDRTRRGTSSHVFLWLK